MISLISTNQAQEIIADKMRAARVHAGLTQAGLAVRSGVSLAVLRKFERSGQISLASFLKLALVLDLLEDVVGVFDKKLTQFESIDEVLQEAQPERKRGWIK